MATSCARSPYAYIGWAKGARRLAWVVRHVAGNASRWMALRSANQAAAPRGRGSAERHHGKGLPPSDAEALMSLETPIELRPLQHVIPFSIACEVVLSDPDHLVALECPCRAGVEHPSLPSDACLIVGEPFAQFILDHPPSEPVGSAPAKRSTSFASNMRQAYPSCVLQEYDAAAPTRAAPVAPSSAAPYTPTETGSPW